MGVADGEVAGDDEVDDTVRLQRGVAANSSVRERERGGVIGVGGVLVSSVPANSTVIHSCTKHTNSNWSPLTLIGAHCHVRVHVFPIISTQEMQSGDMQVMTSYHSAMRNNDCLTVLSINRGKGGVCKLSFQCLWELVLLRGFNTTFPIVCVCVVITFITNTCKYPHTHTHTHTHTPTHTQRVIGKVN